MKEAIQPQSLSDPRPRYSQGIVTQPGKMLFIAGQTASDKNHNVVGKGDIEAQAKQVFENIQAVLKEVGQCFRRCSDGRFLALCPGGGPGRRSLCVQALPW